MWNSKKQMNKQNKVIDKVVTRGEQEEEIEGFEIQSSICKTNES